MLTSLYIKFPIIFLILFFASGITSSCSKQEEQIDPNSKVVFYSERGSPTTLDPIQSSTRYSNLIVTTVYDILYDYKYLKFPYELKCGLAEHMPFISPDGLVYTIKIKKGVKFIDDPAFPDGKGREVTVHDFIYSMKRHFDPKNRSQGNWVWHGKIAGFEDWKKNGADYNKDVAGLKALDPYTIQIILTKPFPQFVHTLTMGFAGVVPREAVEKYGKEFSVHPVGSGPYYMGSFNPKKIVLIRNPHYRNEICDIYDEGYNEAIHGSYGLKSIHGKKLPIVDKIVVRFIEEENSRWNSFNKGTEIQNTVIPIIQVDNVLLSKQKPYKLKPEYEKDCYVRDELDFGLVYSAFNMEDPNFGQSSDPEKNKKNKALRCAIRKAFNWPERIKRFYFGLGEAFPGVIQPGLEGYGDLPNDSIVHDIAAAKKLLKDAGFTPSNLPVLEYSSVATMKDKQFFEQFRGWLKKIGYPSEKIKYRVFANFGDFITGIKEKQLVFFPLAWGLDYPDSENLLQLFYGPNESPGSNSTNYKNPEFDKMYEQAAVMLPGPVRTELYKKMNRIIVDDCVVIAGFSRVHMHFWHKNTIMFPTINIINTLKFIDVVK